MFWDFKNAQKFQNCLENARLFREMFRICWNVHSSSTRLQEKSPEDPPTYIFLKCGESLKKIPNLHVSRTAVLLAVKNFCIVRESNVMYWTQWSQNKVRFHFESIFCKAIQVNAKLTNFNFCHKIDNMLQ